MDFLRKVWAAWKRVGQFIGDMLARVVLSVFYFTIFVPFAVGVRLLSDPLDLKRVEGSHWRERTTRDHDLAEARRLA